MSRMQVVFWGTRGSLPRPVDPSDIREKLARALEEARGRSLASDAEIEAFLSSRLPFAVGSTFGGNTPCVELRGGEEILVLDAGTGLRDLGGRLMSGGDGSPLRIHILMSHLHWDHVQGFPFFTPAYVPGNEVHVYGFHEGIEEAFMKQQDPPFFPVSLADMAASIDFRRLDLDATHEIAGFRVRGFLQNHPGDSYGYSLERDGAKVVYSTDSEHYDDAYDPDYPFVEFIRDADVLIFDAAYSLAEHLESRRHWGHSNNMLGVELAARGGVRHLCLFHHDHTVGDEDLGHVLDATSRYAELSEAAGLRVDVAYDGMEISL